MSLRTVHVLRKFDRAEWGGTETAVERLVEGLRENDVEAIFYAPRRVEAIEGNSYDMSTLPNQPSLRDLSGFCSEPGNKLPGYFRFVPSGLQLEDRPGSQESEMRPTGLSDFLHMRRSGSSALPNYEMNFGDTAPLVTFEVV